MKAAACVWSWLAVLWAMGFVTSAIRGEDWPAFRGLTGLGYSKERNLPISWGGDNAEKVLWQSPLIGEGHASPIVWGDRLFVCTAHWDASTEKRESVIPEHHVLCYRAADGERLWDTLVEPGQWLRSDFRSGAGGGYAAPTPATDGELVYAVFGSSVIAAVDFEGHIVWRNEIEPHTFDVTIGSSPVLYGDTVLMLCSMANKADSRIIAYDKRDGSVKWETPLPNTGFAHSTPILIEVDGKPQLVVVASGIGETDEGVQSFDPGAGRRIWWCRGGGDAASAAFGAGIIYCDSGRGGPGIAIDPRGEGEVTASHIRWRINNVPEGIGSPIIVDDLVYRLHEPNVLRCWRAADGEEVYAERRTALEQLGQSGHGRGRPPVFCLGRRQLSRTGRARVPGAGDQ